MGIESRLHKALQVNQKAIKEVGKGDQNSVLKIAGFLINVQTEMQSITSEYVGKKNKWKKESKAANKQLLVIESEVKKLEKEKAKRKRSIRDLKNQVDGDINQKKLVQRLDELEKQVDKYNHLSKVSGKVLLAIKQKFGTDIEDWHL